MLKKILSEYFELKIKNFNDFICLAEAEPNAMIGSSKKSESSKVGRVILRKRVKPAKKRCCKKSKCWDCKKSDCSDCKRSKCTNCKKSKKSKSKNSKRKHRRGGRKKKRCHRCRGKCPCPYPYPYPFPPGKIIDNFKTMINFIESVLRRLQAPIQAAQYSQSNHPVVVSAFEFRIS